MGNSPTEKLRLIVSLCLGMAVGFAGAMILKRDRYTVNVITNSAIKMDKRTGESWLFGYSRAAGKEVWKPIDTDSSTAAVPK